MIMDCYINNDGGDRIELNVTKNNLKTDDFLPNSPISAAEKIKQCHIFEICNKLILNNTAKIESVIQNNIDIETKTIPVVVQNNGSVKNNGSNCDLLLVKKFGESNIQNNIHGIVSTQKKKLNSFNKADDDSKVCPVSNVIYPCSLNISNNSITNSSNTFECNQPSCAGVLKSQSAESLENLDVINPLSDSRWISVCSNGTIERVSSFIPKRSIDMEISEEDKLNKLCQQDATIVNSKGSSSTMRNVECIPISNNPTINNSSTSKILDESIEFEVHEEEDYFKDEEYVKKNNVETICNEVTNGDKLENKSLTSFNISSNQATLEQNQIDADVSNILSKMSAEVDNCSSPEKILGENNSLEDNEDVKICENLKMEDFVILSDAEWSDEESSDEVHSVEKKKECSEIKEGKSGDLKPPSDEDEDDDDDDFNLDAAIEEFAKEENKLEGSDDELVKEFSEAEHTSTVSAEENQLNSIDTEEEKSNSKFVILDSEDEVETLLENIKTIDSDNDCFIVQDNNNVILIKDDDKEDLLTKNTINEDISVISDTEGIELSNVSHPSTTSPVENEEIFVKTPEKSASVSEENETFKIGCFKSEVFDNDIVEENNQKVNSSVTLELPQTNIQEAQIVQQNNKRNVTDTCHENEEEHSLFSNKRKADNSNMIDEKMEESILNVENEKTSILNKKTDLDAITCELSGEQSLITCSDLKNDEYHVEKKCLNDIVDYVCGDIDSANHGDSKNIVEEGKETGEKDINIVIDSVQSCQSQQITSLETEVMTLDSPCKGKRKSKKRKLLNSKNESVKKMKEGEENESASDVVSNSAMEEINLVEKKLCNDIIKELPPRLFLKKKHLNIIAKDIYIQATNEQYCKEVTKEKKINEELKRSLKMLYNDEMWIRSKFNTYHTTQQELFRQHGYNPVECDVSTSPQPVQNKLTSQSMPPQKTPVLANKVSPQIPIRQPVKKLDGPKTVPIPNINNRPRTAIATSSTPRFIAPNVTITGRAVIPAPINVPPHVFVPQAPVNIPKAASNQNKNQIIDLTDDEPAKNVVPVSTTVITIPSNPLSKVSVAGSNQNVLFPISGVIQMVPSATKNNPHFALSNPVQVQQVQRQTLIPTVPSSLLRPRTVAYFLPTQNSGQISAVPRGSIPVSNLVPGTNQRLSTVFVRVTNPGQIPSLNSVVTSSTRLVTSNFRNLATPSASDLVFLTNKQRHPAPLPPVPAFNLNPRDKRVPPKPRLKGSSAPSGIVLSWDMTLTSEHATIASYNLFAYQESNVLPLSSPWKKVGDVKALPLPMACTLTQFVEGNKYHFSVLAIDEQNRCGPYSNVVTMVYNTQEGNKSTRT
ncbi:activating transcription factor 7-interacting protein 1 [Caerostris darwini]|uniref:Activating transcription factor 7-interacting protein 1 n=1 Tax=Caerostris darwini TaxID=1538125 RepID=A0AAV4QPF5_9ARAC|nr:activating transcription factor 7-interacting protein 1 [Caerostris darwini]